MPFEARVVQLPLGEDVTQTRAVAPRTTARSLDLKRESRSPMKMLSSALRPRGQTLDALRDR